MKFAALWIAATALLGTHAFSQGDRSLTDLDKTSPLAEGITIPLPILEPIPMKRERNDQSQEQILLLRSTIKSLTDSLALSNSEAEVFKRQANELSLRLEALGVPGLGGDPGKLEQRLVSAVRDLRIAQEQLEATRSQLIQLSETVQLLIANSEATDPEIRMNLETQIRKTNEVLGAAAASSTDAVEATLTDAMVIDTKAELSLVISNVGARHGVRVGMPFQVWRNNQRVGEVRVVDVRERICGAIIQSLENEKNPIKTGDRLRVDTKQ